jgi:hypothetical protein
MMQLISTGRRFGPEGHGFGSWRGEKVGLRLGVIYHYLTRNKMSKQHSMNDVGLTVQT